MRINKFREKLLKHIDKALDGEVDEEMEFSELWAHCRDHVDALADDEDMNNQGSSDDEEDEIGEDENDEEP